MGTTQELILSSLVQISLVIQRRLFQMICFNHWKVLYKVRVFYVDRNFKMTTTAEHSFYIGLIGSFYNQVNDTGS
jgi:hypothetical protein